MLNKRNKNIIIGYLIMAVSITLLSFNYINLKKDKIFNDINLEYYTLADPALSVTVPDSQEIILEGPSEVQVENPTYSNYYIGNLEIPKINLNRGFVDINSEDNNISKNVTIVKTSDMPDVDKGNFILAAHSGSAYISYFNDLYKLNNGDYAYVTYNGVKYTYQITKIYTQPKTGQIGIYRDHNKTTLTLVTCTNTDKTTQTIYIAELISKN
jgi:LPXTG-site transpeptidase (sortase) family protein